MMTFYPVGARDARWDIETKIIFNAKTVTCFKTLMNQLLIK